MPLSPITDEDWPEETRGLRDGFAGQLNVYRIMAHHPALLNAWAPLREHVVKQSALGAERSEIVILRTGYRLGSDYEWAHHVHRARALGMSDARISAMRGAPEGVDGLIARAVDALIDHKALAADLEAECREQLGKEALFDLIATVGFYSVLGYLLNTYDPPIDQDVAAAMDNQPLDPSNT